MHELLKYRQVFRGHFPSATLVSPGGISESVTQHGLARIERRPHQFMNELGARREHQQQLGIRTQFTVAVVEQDIAHFFSQRRAARLTGQDHFMALRCQPVMNMAHLGTLASSFAALQCDK